MAAEPLERARDHSGDLLPGALHQGHNRRNPDVLDSCADPLPASAGRSARAWVTPTSTRVATGSAMVLRCNERRISQRAGRRRSVPVFDHGFLYGEGVYETLRTYGRDRSSSIAIRCAAAIGGDDGARRAVHRRRPARRVQQTMAAHRRFRRGLHPHPADARRGRAHLQPSRHARRPRW